MRRKSRPHANRGVVPTALLLLALAGADANAQLRQPRSTAAPALPAVKSITAGPVLKTGAITGSATGGQEVVLRVELTAPAPCVERCGGKTVNGALSGYMRVMLSSDNAGQAPPSQMFVNTGQTAGEAKFVTVPVVSATSFTISAWTEGSAPQRVRLTVQPPFMTHFALAKTSAVSGETVKGIVHFSGPPASANAVKFQLQTTNGQAVKVPATVTLESNKTAAEFDVVALGVPQDRNAHVVAIYLNKTLPAPLTVRAAVLTTFENEWPCCDNPFKIALNGAPPPQGAVIQMTSANPARIVVPPTLTIAAGATSINHTAQSIPGNGDDRVRITASYNGVSKHWSVLSRKIVKPDLVIRDIVFYDMHSNVITVAADGQPIKMCATVRNHRPGDSAPNVIVPPSMMRVSYTSPTGTGTGIGRTIDLPIAFVQGTPYAQNNHAPVTQCINLPGLAPGDHHDIEFVADFRKEVDESSEGNNTEKVKVSRPND